MFGPIRRLISILNLPFKFWFNLDLQWLVIKPIMIDSSCKFSMAHLGMAALPRLIDNLGHPKGQNMGPQSQIQGHETYI